MNNRNNSFGQVTRRGISKVWYFVAGFLALIVLATVLSTAYTIDDGVRGVLLRNGRVIGTVDPGFHLKIPVVDSVVEFSVRDNAVIYDNIEAYSKDLQMGTLQISVSYRLPESEVANIYSNYGTEQNLLDRLITRKLMEQSKVVFGKFTAETSVNQRERLNSEVAAALQTSVEGPVIIRGVQFEDVEFSPAFAEANEKKQLANVAVETEKQALAKDLVTADRVRAVADGEADAKRANAQAVADAILMEGKAKAESFALQAKALGENPALIELTKAERWNGTLPTTVLPNGTLPFIDATNKSSLLPMKE